MTSPLPLSEAELDELFDEATDTLLPRELDARLLENVRLLRAALTAAQERNEELQGLADANATTAGLFPELEERLEKAEAALRAIAAGTFKPDEVARAALSKEAGSD